MAKDEKVYGSIEFTESELEHMRSALQSARKVAFAKIFTSGIGPEKKIL